MVRSPSVTVDVNEPEWFPLRVHRQAQTGYAALPEDEMIDGAQWFEGCEDLAERAPSSLARGLQGSAILKIAGEVNALKAQGVEVGNFTIGDFQPRYFPVPDGLVDRIKGALDERQTNHTCTSIILQAGRPQLCASLFQQAITSALRIIYSFHQNYCFACRKYGLSLAAADASGLPLLPYYSSLRQ